MPRIVMPRLALITLYVPAAMAARKGFLLASEYRKRTGVRVSPKAIQVEACDRGTWLAVRHYRTDGYGTPEPELPAAPIPGDVRQAMIRRWRQGALGLRA
jgi:hypothetical protein